MNAGNIAATRDLLAKLTCLVIATADTIVPSQTLAWAHSLKHQDL